MQTDRELIQEFLKSSKLERPVVSTGPTQYFERAFIQGCINSLQRLLLEQKLDPDRQMTPLELLGLHTLAGALGVEPRKDSPAAPMVIELSHGLRVELRAPTLADIESLRPKDPT